MVRKISIPLFLIVFLFSLNGCEEMDIDSLENDGSKTDQKLFLDEGPISYTGLDVYGNERTCTDKYFDQICSMQFTESDAYGLNCERNGDLAVSCGCHDWICVESEPDERNDAPMAIKGVDINGLESSCVPMSEKDLLVCTEVFTDQDQFALDCRNNGDLAIQCGCHQYLCTKN